MLLKDFFFSFKQSIQRDLEKNKFFKSFKKIFVFPYKYFLNYLRELFLLDKVNLNKQLNNDQLKQKNLNELFLMFNCDKGSKVEINGNLIQGHDYSPFYEKYFSKYKNKEKINILEIGTLRGASSASFFYYFNYPNIYCLDINPFQIKVFSKHIRKIFVDVTSKKILDNVSRYLNVDFDIIIDDASHNIRDQIITLNTFFPKLKKNGIYVIEDISQYISSKNLNPNQLNYGVKDFIQSIKNQGMHQSNFISKQEKKYLNKNINQIFFEKGKFIVNNINISEIVFIEKL
tara:strand:- start:162 stop:1025 length:864 start_codon:yes stop_codon:yes gene_type:complete